MEGLQYTPQSLDGHPPRLAENYEQQMTTELKDRDGMAGPLRTKVRQHVNPRAGMTSGGQMYPPPQPQHPSQQMPSNYPSHPAQMYPASPSQPMYSSPPSQEYADPYESSPSEYAYGPRVRQARPELTCIQVAEHIKTCPICSKFYDTDKSTYVVIIGLLLILAVILLKRILESKPGSSNSL